MKKLYTTSTLLFLAVLTFAQTAMVQVIHNSPIPGTDGGPTVDIYLNGNSDMSSPDIAGFAFRSATPFIALPAGPTQIHIVAASGNPMTDTVLYAEANLVADENYSVIASGVVGSGDTPFGLSIKAGASTSSEVGSNDLLIFHGSPDAPAVIIDAKGVANLESQLAFGEFGDVRRVPNGDYIIDIKPGSDSTAIVARYMAPLKSLGLDGGSATVFASGFLGETPAFGIYATLANGATVALPDTAIAQLQVIHNSPFDNAEGGPTVDIFVNGQAPTAPPLKDFAFRTATPFIELPGNVDFTFDVVPAGGTIDQSIYTLPAGELGNNSLTVMANGIAGSGSQPFNLSVAAGARSYSSDASTVEFNAFHGAPDAPAVDIDILTVGQVVDSMSFGSFNNNGYLGAGPGEYYIGVRANGSTATVATFKADLTGLLGGAATVFASGFLANSNASGFGLFAALPNGAVAEFPMENVARVQVVHDAPVAEFVDVWLGGSTKAIANFEFETATPFLTIPIDSSISITAPGSSDTSGNFLTIAPGSLMTGETYYVVAAGDALSNFGVEVYAGARESASSGSGIDLQAFHGSPDAPAVDVRVRNAFPLFENLEPRAFGDDYVNAPEDIYLLDITLPGSEDALFTFAADLTGLDGGAALAFASGYATRSAAIDSSFKLLVALPNGTVARLPLYSIGFANIVHAASAAAADSVDVYVGDIKVLDNFAYLQATGYVELPTNSDITVNLKNSSGPSDGVVLTIPANTLSKDSAHVVIVHGDGSADYPISVNFINNARPGSTTPGTVNAIAFHAVAGVGAVDIRNGGDFSFPTVIGNLDYGSFSDYLELPPNEYDLRLTPTGSFDGVATFSQEILESDESVIFLAAPTASGVNLFTILPDGNVLASIKRALAQIVHNVPVAAVNPADIWISANGVEIGVLRNVPFRSATNAAYFPTLLSYEFSVAPAGSTSSADAVVTFPVMFEDGKDYSAIAIGDGDNQPLALTVQDASRFAARDGSFDIQVMHGAPDAPSVNILADGNEVVNSLEYGTYQGYLGLGENAFKVTITDVTGTVVVGTYDAPVDSWLADGYTSGTIFASGYLAPGTDQPGFELWIAFPDGTTQLLDVVSSLNELQTLLTGMNVMPNPMSESGLVKYNLEESMEVSMRIISMDGRIVQQQDLGTQGQGQHTVSIETYDLSPGTYQLQMLNERGSVSMKIVVLN